MNFDDEEEKKIKSKIDSALRKHERMRAERMCLEGTTKFSIHFEELYYTKQADERAACEKAACERAETIIKKSYPQLRFAYKCCYEQGLNVYIGDGPPIDIYVQDMKQRMRDREKNMLNRVMKKNRREEIRERKKKIDVVHAQLQNLTL